MLLTASFVSDKTSHLQTIFPCLQPIRTSGYCLGTCRAGKIFYRRNNCSVSDYISTSLSLSLSSSLAVKAFFVREELWVLRPTIRLAAVGFVFQLLTI
jgi:hypothetical protein